MKWKATGNGNRGINMSIRLTEEEVRDIVYEDSEKYFLIDEFIDGTSRWHVHKTGVISCSDNGKYYIIYWNEGATEMQENEFWSQTAPEVEQKEVIVKKWKPVK